MVTLLAQCSQKTNSISFSPSRVLIVVRNLNAFASGKPSTGASHPSQPSIVSPPGSGSFIKAKNKAQSARGTRRGAAKRFSSSEVAEFSPEFERAARGGVVAGSLRQRARNCQCD